VTDLTVLVVGSGGREHALALAIAADPGVVAVHVAPGNPGTWHSWPSHVIDQLDGQAVAALATSVGADLVVIGPEARSSQVSPTPYVPQASPASGPPRKPHSWRGPSSSRRT